MHQIHAHEDIDDDVWGFMTQGPGMPKKRYEDIEENQITKTEKAGSHSPKFHNSLTFAKTLSSFKIVSPKKLCLAKKPSSYVCLPSTIP